MNSKWIRKFKYHFFKYKIHRILPRKKAKFLVYLGEVSKWINDHKDGLEFSDFPSKTFDYSRRYDLYKHLLANQLKDVSIDYLEFGVSTGISFKWWLNHVTDADSRFYGFDTFDGLPEDWGPFKKGDMSNGGAPPVYDDPRYELYQGVFQKTLNDFLKNYQSDKRKVIHMDADIYSGTLFVLTTIHPFLSKGDIILFDEFNVPMHEFKAFQEWTEAFYVDYQVIGQVNNFYQMALILK